MASTRKAPSARMDTTDGEERDAQHASASREKRPMQPTSPKGTASSTPLSASKPRKKTASAQDEPERARRAPARDPRGPGPRPPRGHVAGPAFETFEGTAERLELRAELPMLASRFASTLTHPVEQAIAPAAILALASFTDVFRKPTRWVTFGWIEPRTLIEHTPIDDDHPIGLAVSYLAVIAAFFRWRAEEGALDPATADRLSSTLLQASMSMQKLADAPSHPRSGSSS